jgi:tRNA pseudouridine13 synthase
VGAEAPDEDPWRALALAPPRAWGDTPVSGALRVELADFDVEEHLGFSPDGGDAHRLLLVEKSDANTVFVARALAVRAARPASDIGFAGQKDRRSVARQWFSVPATRETASFVGYSGQGFRVLAEHAHSRKLRRGSLAGNRFHIRVRGLQGDARAIATRVEHLSRCGVPNYYGGQRFGREGANLGRVREWLASGKLPRSREPRAYLLSSARSLAFNAVLASRVAGGTWNRLLPGEVVNLAGSRSVFTAEFPDEGLQKRLADGDVSPTGPLCGAGGVLPGGEAARVENAALAAVTPVPALLAALGMRGERRALVLRPQGFRHRLEGDTLELEFELPRGAFATSLLREIVDVRVPDAAGDAD